MVHRRKIAVFDLDGTVYAGPSLRRYFMFGARKLLMRGRIGEGMAILVRFAAWKFAGIMSHQAMKHANCVCLEKHLTEKDINIFTETLASGTNADVMRLMHHYRNQGCLTVLATASPESYCIPLARRLGFDMCTATVTTASPDAYTENRGETKLKSIRRIGGTISAVVTDHSDDLPLLKADTDGDNWLVRPSGHTLDLVRNAGIRFR
ncbi:MAG: haloacid dehalogenase-like hydrolase, partial [Muribaculaceae bacterium]|nr:haloacid dehalogenase-like hydrolase [Muribaculaceae bacterium]